MLACEIAVVGRIGMPYGVKGWVHVRSFTDPAENLLEYRPWYIAEDDDGPWGEPVEPLGRHHRDGFVAKLAGVDDREAAGGLRGRWIGVPVSALKAPEPGEYLWRDLAGCAVVDVAGTELGVVDHLLETGAHDVLVVTGGRHGELLIPFVAQYVTAVDSAARRITVDWDPDWS